MTDLLDELVAAHGGLKRWNELQSLTAHLTQGGAVWALKNQPGVLDDVNITTELHTERESHYPFGAPGQRSVFTPQRVTIETENGTVLEALDNPRASFAGHVVDTPWTRLQLAYFVGTAMWTYLTQPFSFTMPGFETTELKPWEENGERWRRLQVTWPDYLATTSTVQTVYVGDDGLVRREDYEVDIMGGSAGAHYMSGYTQVDDIMLPAGHRIYARTPDGRALMDQLLVAIDLSDIKFA